MDILGRGGALLSTIKTATVGGEEEDEGDPEAADGGRSEPVRARATARVLRSGQSKPAEGEPPQRVETELLEEDETTPLDVAEGPTLNDRY